MGDHSVASSTDGMTFSGAETKVKASTTAGGSTAGIAVLILYGLGKVTGISDDAPDAVKVALLGVITAALSGLAAFYAGWKAKHTHRADLAGPANLS